MNPRVSAEVRKKTIARVVEDLLLSHRMDVKIGSLSGGQRKRLTLATQVIFFIILVRWFIFFKGVFVLNFVREIVDDRTENIIL